MSKKKAKSFTVKIKVVGCDRHGETLTGVGSWKLKPKQAKRMFKAMDKVAGEPKGWLVRDSEGVKIGSASA